MAHFDLHEQEQLSKLKYFWRDWGKYIIIILVLALAAYISSLMWNSHAASQSNNASVIYSQLNKANLTKDTNGVYGSTDKLIAQYPKTEYTAMGALFAAKVAYSAKSLDKATNYLNWVISNASDKGLVDIAMIRMADIYIDGKKFEQALNLLMQKHEQSFDALFYSKRGDLYVAKGDLNKARDAYKEAITKAGQDQSVSGIIQMKLDVLGS